GSLVMVAMILTILMMGVRRKGFRGLPGELAAFALGLLPMLALLIWFRLRLAPGNDLIAGQTWKLTWQRLLDGSRYTLIASSLFRGLLQIGPFAVVFLAIYFCLLGRAPCKSACRRTGYALFLLAPMLVGYVLVYLTTPNPLEWHLATS